MSWVSLECGVGREEMFGCECVLVMFVVRVVSLEEVCLV